jgi:hypothetical protein
MHEVNGNVEAFTSGGRKCYLSNKSAVKLCYRIFYIYFCGPPATARDVTRDMSSSLKVKHPA